MLEKSEFKDESQYFRFHADEEMEGTGSKNKQLRNDFKLVENILAKRLLVGAELSCCPSLLRLFWRSGSRATPRQWPEQGAQP